MILKRSTANESSQEQRDNPATEIIKSDKEVLENFITATMVSKAMGTLKKSDITLLTIVYNDFNKDSNLADFYGKSGPISDFVSEAQKYLPKYMSDVRLNRIELLVQRPFTLKSVTCYFDGSDKTFQLDDFSKTFGRIVYRLK